MLKGCESNAEKSYCEQFGWPAKEPELMFMQLFLKKLYEAKNAELI